MKKTNELKSESEIFPLGHLSSFRGGPFFLTLFMLLVVLVNGMHSVLHRLRVCQSRISKLSWMSRGNVASSRSLYRNVLVTKHNKQLCDQDIQSSELDRHVKKFYMMHQKMHTMLLSALLHILCFDKTVDVSSRREAKSFDQHPICIALTQTPRETLVFWAWKNFFDPTSVHAKISVDHNGWFLYTIHTATIFFCLFRGDVSLPFS